MPQIKMTKKSFVTNRVQREGSLTQLKSREELLFAGNETLHMENVIDESAKVTEEEFKEIDHYDERTVLVAEAWEAEFHNCMNKYAEMYDNTYNEYDVQMLRLWGDFIELWAENFIQILN